MTALNEGSKTIITHDTLIRSGVSNRDMWYYMNIGPLPEKYEALK